ncbi:unnamed protein product [Clonostachys solani]|uniref:SGNH hydrolase-type esterase domain-containing protein n=1 Tax=Clonostachys solani TaxID=160281 RepID=A0A9N9W4A4_9HYPO|nr:unnamed protein product [Clonostachys solani]
MAVSLGYVVSFLLHLLLLPLIVASTPAPLNNAGHSAQVDSRQASQEKPFLLRIMPLGASITAGVGTNPQNGYRKPLRDQLRWRGWPVNMVGSMANGNPVAFHNRQHEGHPGIVVRQMIGVANDTVQERKPNLVLINCGTNDADPSKNQDIPGTGRRMEDVLEFLYSSITDVTVILSTLIPRKDAANANVTLINNQYRALAQRLGNEGRKIVLAELNNGFLDPNTDYAVNDNIHPNEKGAAKLAAVWDQAIAEAERRGFLTAPINTGIPDYHDRDDGGPVDTTCDVERGAGRGPIKTQVGYGFDDGLYSHAEGATRDLNLGTTKIPNPNGAGTSVSFAQLVNVNNIDPGGERDELVYCTDTEPDKTAGSCMMLLNVNGNFPNNPVRLDVGLSCLARGIRWGDVNGDGLDDFICINLCGNMYVAINEGGNPPKFVPTGNGGLIREGEPWGGQDRVRLGDMDGDGRLDYCAIDDQGDIYCWRNGGVGRAPTEAEGGSWQDLVGGEPTFYAQHEAEGIAGVHLVDINGDRRSDWVYVYKDGSSKIFVNQRGDYDNDGKGLRPHWARAQKEHAAISFVTSPGQVYFGRVEGTGRADRVAIDTSGTNGFKLLGNQGSGGTRRKGDGVFYCDMFGRGRDDYLWVLSTGEITLFENIQAPPNWGQHGVIINIDRERKSIHFGDWDGDGLCDILAVERHTGRVEWWRNTFKNGDKSPTFDGPKWVVDGGSNLCTEGWGTGLYGQGLRFADLDGDKRVDYLCMGKDGRTVGSLNKANGLEYKGQIKFAPTERLDRANFRWADVSGDGLVDLIWVNKSSGVARVWKNGGFIPAGGSSMTWIDQGFRFDGHGRGENIHFPILGSQERADYHDVYPGTAMANTWFNECLNVRVGEGVDDYPEPFDPMLPLPPTNT